MPEPYGGYGHWELSAFNALDSGRTCERGGRQHPARSGLPCARELPLGMSGAEAKPASESVNVHLTAGVR